MKKLVTISGLTFVTAWIAGLMSAPAGPKPSDSAAHIQNWYAAHEHAAMLQTAFVDAIAGLALIGIAIATYRTLSTITTRRPRLVRGACLASLVAGVISLFQAVCAALIAGADGVFDSATRAEALTTMLTRVAAGQQAFPALVPDPFDELAARVDEEDRRIVAMLLLRAKPDEIARVLGISARSFRARLRMIVRRLDAGYLADRAAPDVARRPREVVNHGRQRRQYARAVSVPLQT